MNYCQRCGAANQPGGSFCEKCGAPLAVAPAPTQVSAQVAPQASTPAKRRSAVPIVVAVVLIVLLLAAGGVGYSAFGPMSEADYEDAAQDFAGDIYNAQSEIDAAAYVMYFSMDSLQNDEGVPFPEDDLINSEVQDARDVCDKNVEDIEAAAAEIEKLRPPHAYKTEDEALVAWAAFMVDEWLPGYDELLSNAEDGMTYGEFSEDYDSLMESLSDAGGDDVWNEYWDAADELHID